MGSNRSANQNRYWTEEKHVQFLNSMEASFVREMFENNDSYLLPRLDRYLPDTSDSTLDLKKTHRRFSTTGGSRERNDSADEKASRSLSSRPYNSSQDQVVPQLEIRAGDKAERDHSIVSISTTS